MIAQARRLWELGLSIIPIPRPRPGCQPGMPGDGKVPAIAWLDFQRQRATLEQVERWFAPLMNIAIIAGAISDIVVIDGDSPAAVRWVTRHLPYTPWQTKTSRGFHFFYRHPGRPVANRARVETRDGRLAIDVRGDGGFVIAAPSLHATGFVYQEAGDWNATIDQLPRFWPGWLERPTRAGTPRPIMPRRTGDVVERARRYLAAIPRPDIGAGSDAATLCAACRLVRGFGLSASDAVDLLWAWAGNRPGWTHQWMVEKVAHAERYGSEPIGALR